MKDWVIKTVETAQGGSSLRITGTNNCTDIEADRSFCWTIGYCSVLNDRYDWSGAEWGEGARRVYEQLRFVAGARS